MYFYNLNAVDEWFGDSIQGHETIGYVDEWVLSEEGNGLVVAEYFHFWDPEITVEQIRGDAEIEGGLQTKEIEDERGVGTGEEGNEGEFGTLYQIEWGIEGSEHNILREVWIGSEESTTI